VFALFLIGVYFIVSVLVPLLEKKAKHQPDGVRITYFLMVTPFMWVAAITLNSIKPRLGYYIIGSMSMLFLVVALIACAKYLHQIFRKV
jgi:phosphatidylglycerophosphate synthase